jgi:hypothetical protein
MSSVHLAIRHTRGNPNYHLWNNNGTWFVHCTVHLPDFRKTHLRRSLGTRSIRLARCRRDEILRGQNDTLEFNQRRELP